MHTEVHRIGPGDTWWIDRVAEDVFDETVDPGRLAAYLAERSHLMVLGISGGVVVGQARGMVHRHPDLPTELYIDNLGVTPDRRREGIAAKLLDELVAWARECGCEEAWVATETDNGPARALYETRGAEAETFVLYYYDFEAT